MNFLFQVFPLDVLPVNYLLNASFFKRLVIIIFVDPLVTEKCLQQMILHRPVDFTTALANNKTLSPLIIITRRQFVLVLLLDHSSKPFTHSRQQSYPERQWPSTLEAPIPSSSCYCFPTLFTAAFHLTYQRLLSTQNVAKC